MENTYESPTLVEVGSVEELTLHSSKSGRDWDGFGMGHSQMPTS